MISVDFKKASIIINFIEYMQKNVEISSNPLKKFLFSLLFLGFSTAGFSQPDALIINRSISWKTHSASPSLPGNAAQNIYAESCLPDPLRKHLPVYREIFSTKNYAVQQIQVLSYQLQDSLPIPSEWISYIPNEPEISFQNASERGQRKAIISMLPFVRVGNKIYAIRQFQFSCTFNPIQPVFHKKSFKNNSVLASGDWYKIAVLKTGICKLDAAFFKNAGIDISKINPKKLGLFGFGAGMLPQPIQQFRYDDLKENAIVVSGESDGVFNSGDYVLFNGQAQQDKWNYHADDQSYHHSIHIYSDTTYYFLHIGSAADADGMRVQTVSSSNQIDSTSSEYDYLYYKEDETYNLVKSGRNWVGQLFDLETDQGVLSINIPHAVTQVPVFIRSSTLARSFTASQFQVVANGQKIITHSLDPVPTDYEYYACNPDIQTARFSSNDGSVNLRYTYNKPSSESIGWLDFVEVQARASLYNLNGNFRFSDARGIKAGRFLQYEVHSARKLRCWDISNPLEPFEITGSFDASSSNFRFTIQSDSLRQFALFDETNYPSAQFIGKLTNQNLHGLAAADDIIITHPMFMAQAQKLAEFHRKRSQLRVTVVNVHDIYNEFSSGSQDICAIRDFLRLMYMKAASSADQPRFVTLFGRASYDYKFRFKDNTNFIPTFESNLSYNFNDSYNSDDFYGLLEDGEGNWDTGSDPDELLDLGIGRLPVKNTDEADIMLAKAESYLSADAYGDWRNRMVFVSDDEDNNEHQNQSNKMADNVFTNYKRFNVQKIFIDAYKEVTGSGGKRNPDAQADIVRSVQRGCLLINYTGHGGEVGWSHKRILNTDDIQGWSNAHALPLFITATCEFSRFDDPTRNAAGEMTLLNPNGGGIALLTTVRLVYVTDNNSLNNAFYLNCGIDSISQLKPNYFGDIMRMTKNTYNTKNTRNFTLLGDPALFLAYPRYFVKTTAINGKALASYSDTIKALSKYEISGSITDEFGKELTQFNGYVYPTVYDKVTTYKTLENNPTSPQMDFTMQNNIIYRGKASVSQGKFSFSFIVPKDISYQFGSGKISYYANSDSNDASGYYETFTVGGTGNGSIIDKTGPVMQLFMNDKQFVNGGLTGSTPDFIAVLKDSSGINTVGRGIGRNLMATLQSIQSNNTDNNNDLSVSLNDYYQADANSFQSGEIRYKFSQLSPGKYRIKLNAYDVFNNASEGSLDFEVRSESSLQINHVLNYPNPFTTQTAFMFDHNQAGADLDVQVQIYTVSGRCIKTLRSFIPQAPAHVASIVWDGRDEFGDKPGKGVYLYRISVRSGGEKQQEAIQKLVILN